MAAARLAWFAMLAAVAFVALYGAALGTSLGRRGDAAAIVRDFGPERLPRIHEATTDLLRTIDVSSLVLFGGGMVALALVQGRAGSAFAAAALVAGANVTTQLLKPALADLQIFRDADRDPSGGFPSGHATVAMSLALALVLVVPAALRVPAVVAGASYAAGVGVALLALGWHYASDVAGGFLVASFWAGLVGALALSRRPTRRARARAPSRRRLTVAVATATALVTTIVFAAVLAAAVERYAAVVEYGRAHTTFFAVSVALAALSLVCVAAFATLVRTIER